MRNLAKDNSILKMSRIHFFNKNTANLVINKSFSNIFITVTDLNKRVIICKSSGACGVGHSKKMKKAPQSIENIIKHLVPIFEQYKLKYFNLILKIKFSNHLIILIKELYSNGYKIVKFINKIKIAHNGMRGRKLRRI